jgi:RimJ/RimL family protein N-acetyltransferase
MRQIFVRPRVQLMAAHRIDTERLRLRVPTLADAEDVARLIGNWRVAYWLVRVPYPYRVEHARAWIERSLEERAAGLGWPFLIERRDDRALVGSIDLSIEDDRSSGALGYWVAEEWWGHGYATEAGQAMVRFAFEVALLNQVTASVLPENARSVRVLEKAGFRHAGPRHEETYERGRVDIEYFTLERPNARPPGRSTGWIRR